MKRLVLSVLVLAAIAVAVTADDKPSLPRVARGFDEGRKAFVDESADGLIQPAALVERLFEQADLFELSLFIHVHLLTDEKRGLDASLKLGGGLAACRDVAAVQALLARHTPAEVAAAIGGMLVARKFTLSDVGAWLYARGFNFRVLQRALNGERLDALRLRASLRAMKDHSAGAVFVPGIWEFNLDDSREEKGGTYSGMQLVEALLALGWSAADFAQALGIKEFPAAQRKLFEWGDPALLWVELETYVSEAEMLERVLKRYRANDDPRVLQLALSRAACSTRWFRTGGPGVRAVYRGPWPNAKGEPVPPTSVVNAIEKVDNEGFINALTAQVYDHFKAGAETLTLVTYTDGSARAILEKPKHEPLDYRADTPFGEGESHRQAYEGRVSLQGQNALLYLVYGEQVKAAPAEFEFANVKLAAEGAFLTADLDDGVNLTPILLRRVTRLVE